VTTTLLRVMTALLVGGTLVASPVWTAQTSGVEARLRGVSAVSQRVAWASGERGTILRTTDGGEHWQKLTVPGTEKLDFRDVDAISDRVAYALSIGAGESSRIYKTTDAGATWAEQFVNRDPKAFFDAMAFWDARRGVAFSDAVDNQFVILTTTDGQTWNRVPAEGLPPALTGEGAYAASGTNVAVWGTRHVWIGTTAGRVLRSDNGGRRWNVATTGLATGQSAGIFSIAFRDAMHGVVVGGDYGKEQEAVDNAAVTSDGGQTWRLVKGLSGFRSVVTHLPPASSKHWLAVGPAGADYSTDDGRTWQPVGGPGFHAFSFAPSGGVGWGVGEGGRVARLRW
jgi:photosystem II stability/assembly factor-like uncharacterized protein